MKRPLLVRLAPDRLKQSLFYRFYNPLPKQLVPLCDSCDLRFAPAARMVGLLHSDIIGSSIAVTGFYELDLSRRIVALARRRGGCFIDVGANIGYFTILWLSTLKTNRAHCFEASPRNVGFLSTNLAVNNLGQRAVVYAQAAGKQAGQLAFDPGSEQQTGWGGFSPAGAPSRLQVDVVRIDQVFTSNEPIEVLKIDVEGADTWVLLGCEELLNRKQIRRIFFEQNLPRMRQLDIDPALAQRFLQLKRYHVTCLGKPNDETAEYMATII